MFTATEVNRLKSNVDAMLIQAENMLPNTGTNTGKVALLYWLYRWMERQIEGKFRRVTKDAIECGIIFDHKKAPLPEFTEMSLYKDDWVEVRVVVSAASKQVDLDHLSELLVTGDYITEHQLNLLKIEATKTNKPAHRFSAVLMGDETKSLPIKVQNTIENSVY